MDHGSFRDQLAFRDRLRGCARAAGQRVRRGMRPGSIAIILCERVVGNDNCVRYRNVSLQIPPSPLRAHFVKARVRVHDYPDGTLAIFHGATLPAPHMRPVGSALGVTGFWPPEAAGRPARTHRIEGACVWALNERP